MMAIIGFIAMGLLALYFGIAGFVVFIGSIAFGAGKESLLSIIPIGIAGLIIYYMCNNSPFYIGMN